MADSVGNLWRRTAEYFGVDSIAFAQERKGREQAQQKEIAALRAEVEDLKERLIRVERKLG